MRYYSSRRRCANRGVIPPIRVMTLEPMIRPGAGSGSLAPSTIAMWKAELDLFPAQTRGAGHDVYLSLLLRHNHCEDKQATVLRLDRLTPVTHRGVSLCEEIIGWRV